MNRTILVILLTIAVINSALATTSSINFNYNKDYIDASYSFEQPSVSEVDGLVFVEIAGLTNSFDVDQPVLPVGVVSILIPYGKSAVNFSLNYGDGILIAEGNPVLGEEILPIGDLDVEPIPVGEEEVVVPNWTISDFRGYSVLSAVIYPIEYSEGKFYFYKNIEVRISLEDSVEDSVFLRDSVEDQEIVSSSVDNPEMIESYLSRSVRPLGARILSMDEMQPYSEDQYPYLIITSSELANSAEQYNFTTLLNSKASRQSGAIDGTIVTIEEIGADSRFWCSGIYGDGCGYSGFNDSAAMIRNYIKYAYGNLGTQWVLLGGDSNIIPVRSIYFYLSRSDAYGGYYNIESDIYYSNLNGSFNADLDSHWGESGEIDDYFEVIVGRVPVRNTTELSNFIRKTIFYENLSVNNNTYLKNAFFDYDETVTTLDNVGFFFSGFNLIRKPWAVWGNTSIIEYLNSNFMSPSLFPQIINIAGHGNYDGAGGFFSTNVNSLLNYNYPFFVNSQSCLSGSFLSGTDSHSVFEKLVVAQNGSFGIISNTHYGWIGPSDVIMMEFWEGIENDRSSSVGDAFFEAKQRIYRYFSPYSQYYKWLYFTVNLMGDPEVSLFFEPESVAEVALFVYSPIEGYFYNSTTILLNFSTNSQSLMSISWFNGSENVSYVSGNYNFTEGNNTIQIYANNTEAMLQKEVMFYIDTTPPIINDSSNISARRRQESFFFDISTEDNFYLDSEYIETNISGVLTNYSILNKTDFVSLDSNSSINITTNSSSFSYKIYTIDVAGNTNSTEWQTVQVLNTPPILNESYEVPSIFILSNYSIDKSLVFSDVDPQMLNVSVLSSTNLSYIDDSDEIIIYALNHSMRSGRLELMANDSENQTYYNISFVFYSPDIIIPEDDLEFLLGGTDNASDLNEFANISFIINSSEYGKINFSSVTLNQENINFSGKINISHHRVEVNSTALPFLNNSAIISMNNVSFTNATIFKNGNSVACMSECQIIEHNRTTNVFVFSVSGFSYYTIKEASCVDGAQNCHDGSCESGVDCGGPCTACVVSSTNNPDGGGGGGGGGASPLKVNSSKMNSSVAQSNLSNNTTNTSVANIEDKSLKMDYYDSIIYLLINTIGAVVTLFIMRIAHISVQHVRGNSRKICRKIVLS